MVFDNYGNDTTKFIGSRTKTPGTKDTMQFMPRWTKDTTLFCQPEQMTPHFFATLA